MKALTGNYDGLPGKVPTKIEPADFLYLDSDGWRRMRLARKKIERDGMGTEYRQDNSSGCGVQESHLY